MKWLGRFTEKSLSVAPWRCPCESAKRSSWPTLPRVARDQTRANTRHGRPVQFVQPTAPLARTDLHLQTLLRVRLHSAFCQIVNGERSASLSRQRPGGSASWRHSDLDGERRWSIEPRNNPGAVRICTPAANQSENRCSLAELHHHAERVLLGGTKRSSAASGPPVAQRCTDGHIVDCRRRWATCARRHSSCAWHGARREKC